MALAVSINRDLTGPVLAKGNIFHFSPQGLFGAKLNISATIGLSAMMEKGLDPTTGSIGGGRAESPPEHLHLREATDEPASL
ncbi:hypothetical protein AV530_007333 [Patagioenas fasciata monilis]|uniref:Uncharacterized protein n=1 Tax=Patagioenas fasciata monilis TaxID=372326 RepID=A0A1V4JXG0_PATFA|nr:hypothetical protein AV530_007333 [Patagioenas fasciata monilis]